MIDKGNKGYHKLLVWQRARELVKLVYLSTETFPKSEEFALKSQIRRAVVSVVLNIVEGYRRSTSKDYLHFLNIANSSLAELEAAFEIALDLQFINEKSYSNIESKRSEVGFLLHQLIKSIEKKGKPFVASVSFVSFGSLVI
jgi:four helix bundle protein